MQLSSSPNLPYINHKHNYAKLENKTMQFLLRIHSVQLNKLYSTE